jgi:hypothetical protein
MSIKIDKDSKTIYIVPDSNALVGPWEVYLRVFGDTYLVLPPSVTPTPTGTDIDIVSYISTSEIKIGTWSIYEDIGNLVFKKN